MHSLLANTLILASLVFVSLSAVREVQTWRTSRQVIKEPWAQALASIANPDIADAISRDLNLRRSLVSIVDLTTDMTRVLATRYQLDGFDEAHSALARYRRSLGHGPAKGGVAPRGLGAPSMPAIPLGRRDNIGDILNGTDLASSIKDVLFGDGDPLEALVEPSLFLGIGIGEGTASGLKLASTKDAEAVGDKVAADLNVTSKGLSSVLENLGQGATSTFFGNIDFSSIAGGGSTDGNGGNGTSNKVDLGALLKAIDLEVTLESLGNGLGSGAAMGLNLTKKDVTPKKTNHTILDAAGRFGFGLSWSLTQHIDFARLVSGSGREDGISHNSSSSVDDDGKKESGIMATLKGCLPDAVSGLGKGFGAGIPIALGLQPATPDKESITADGSIDVEGVAENFGKGLATGLLHNGTLDKLMQGSGLLSKQAAAMEGGDSGHSDQDGGGGVKLRNVAQGLARGLIQGVGDGVDQAGGIDALIKGGKAVSALKAEGLPNSTIYFDDSVGGVANGFGQGVGGQLVVVAQELLAARDTETKETSSSIDGRDLVGPGTNNISPLAPRPALGRRDITVALDGLINSETVSQAGQTAIDALTCQGVGGVVLTVASLAGSGALKYHGDNGGEDESVLSLDSLINKLIPDIVVTVTSGGNIYRLDGSRFRTGGWLKGIAINGQRMSAFLSLLVIHILLAIFAFLIITPVAIGLESARRIVVRFQKYYHFEGAPRSVSIMWYMVVAPSLVAVTVTGAMLLQNTKQFRTPHGILGLITAIIGVFVVVIHFLVKTRDSHSSQMRIANVVLKQLFLILCIATTLTGTQAVNKIVLCMTQVVSFENAVGFGFVLSFAVAASYMVVSLDGCLARRRRGINAGLEHTDKMTEDEMAYTGGDASMGMI